MNEDILLERGEVLQEIIDSINLDDPRINRNKKFSLAEIFFVVLLAQLCDFSTFREYELYGAMKLNFLRKFLPYKKGAPSRSTIARFLALFNPKKLEALLINWTQMIIENKDLKQSVLAADGKAQRGFQGNDKMHYVNIYDTKNGLCLGQEKVDDKSNEITALPKLLEVLEIKNQIISADAMHCQKETARIIIARQADYFLALKKNHSDLYDDVKTYFDDKDNLKKCDFYKSIDKDHGRIETRKCYVTNDINWIGTKFEWSNLKSIVAIISTRSIKGITSVETRYFLTSLEPNARNNLFVSRAHWGIENSLNWVLDVIFKEDARIVWNKNVAQNEALIRRIALNLVKKYQAIHPFNRGSRKVAIKTIRKLLWDDEAIFTVLNG